MVRGKVWLVPVFTYLVIHHCLWTRVHAGFGVHKVNWNIVPVPQELPDCREADIET